MNRFFNKENIAFTLAEMMVVLALFSVVSAATLPVITAKQQLGNGDGVAGKEGSAVDPWVKNTSDISYKPSTQSDTSAVMVGGQITDDSKNLGYPQLIVKDNLSTDESSQIVFLKYSGNNPYYAGRIMLGARGGDASPVSIGNVAMGVNAMYSNSAADKSYNVAIGSNAMQNRNDQEKNVAIGANAMQMDFYAKGGPAYGSVAIGTYAGASSQAQNSVLIGYYSGCTLGPIAEAGGMKVGRYKNTVAIGSYAGANSLNARESSVFLGTRAGSWLTGSEGVVAIGYYSGLNSGYLSNATLIGTYAGASDSSGFGSDSGAVAVGTYAGYNSQLNGIYLGAYSGMSEYANGYSVLIGSYAGVNTNYETIAIGNSAAYYNNYTKTQKRVPVIIGSSAMRNSTTSSLTGEAPSVAIGRQAGVDAGTAPYSILIGFATGYGATSLNNAVCIGQRACAGNISGGTNIVRISSKDGYLKVNSSGAQSVIGDVPSPVNNNMGPHWVGGSYDNLLITPLYGNLSYTTDSSIVFFGKVFSAKTTMALYSDRRLKENIRLSKYGLNEIKKINVYQYNWKNDESKKPQMGVIAQELQKIIPEGVTRMKDGYLTVSTTWLVYPMVNAIKELDSKIQKTAKKFDMYTKEYVSLAKRINILEKEVKVLEKENKILTKNVEIAYKKAKNAERTR